MKRFNPPSVGSIVTITTRRPEEYIYATSKWRENTYKDVKVLSPEPWFGPNDIKITGNERMPFRVINMNSVCKLKSGNKNSASSVVAGNNGVVEIHGSTGLAYSVTLINGDATACTCPHYTYRRAYCKHMKQAVTDAC